MFLDGKHLAFKSHPNDLSDYIYDHRSLVVEDKISDILPKSCMVVTINSSAALDVIQSETPLVCLGDSIYTVMEWQKSELEPVI